MYTHRVEVFHIADGDAVALGIAHHLVFNFLPARDTALNEHLPHAGKADAVVRDLAQFLFIIRDAAAGAAKRIGRADDDRITDGAENSSASSTVSTTLEATHARRWKAWYL